MALARSTDPTTSHLAAHGAERSGRAATHRYQCYLAVRANPGRTAAEIAEDIGLERHEPSRRLPELRDQHHVVVNGDERICTVTGNLSMTWYPAEAAEVLA